MKKKKTLNTSATCSDGSPAATLSCQCFVDKINGLTAHECTLTSAGGAWIPNCVDISIIQDSKSGPLLTKVLVLDLSSLKNITEIIVSNPNNLHWINTLNLSNNQISDVSSLVALSHQLAGLILSNNQISDVSSLANVLKYMEGLLILDLSKNNITNIAPLCDLDSLLGLNLANNNILDPSPLTCLKNKMTNLNLCGNPYPCPFTDTEKCITCTPPQ